jgi:flagellar biosynthesis protein FlhG
VSPGGFFACANQVAVLRIVSTTSGKGGVGKTHLTVNLAVSCAQRGQRVLLIDADWGMTNAKILLGSENDRHPCDNGIAGAPRSDYVNSKHGVSILPDSLGFADHTCFVHGARQRLKARLKGLAARFDMVFVDSAAGIGSEVHMLAGACQENIVVVTPEPTSLTDGYAMVKLLSRRYGIVKFNVVVNQTVGRRDARRTFEALRQCCKRFLKVDLRLFGDLPADPLIPDAAMRRTPVVAAHPHAPSSKAIKRMAEILLSRNVGHAMQQTHVPFWEHLIAVIESTSNLAPSSSPSLI